MLITTRNTAASQHLANCSLFDETCRYVDDEPRESYYIADIEKFTIMIEHTMYVPSLGYTKNVMELPGELLDCNNHLVNASYPNSIGVKNSSTGDIIEIDTLLKASCVDLDTSSNVPPSGSGRSKRDGGVVLIMFLTYSNTYSYDIDKFKYTYKASFVKETKFKSEQPIYTKTLTNRVIWDRHGIRVIVLQAGLLGKFDFQVLLITLVSGLGLLAVSTTVVDVLAVYVLPSKKVYKQYKFDETPLLSEKEEYLPVTKSTEDGSDPNIN